MFLGQFDTGWDEFGAYDTATSVATAPPSGAVSAESSDWTTMLPQLVGAVTQWDMARKLYDLNLERVQQGLEPIQAQSVTPGVTVGVADDVKNMIMIGGAVVAGLFLFSMMRKR